MLAIRIERPGMVLQVSVETPEPPPGFVRIKVHAAAICATDLEVVDGRIPANYPLIPGHEWSGTVDAVGDPDDAAWIGRRVTGSNDVVCLKCSACRSGEWRYCKSFEEIGFKRDGAYAEYLIAPVYGLCELPSPVSFLEGALCEPLGVALGTLEKSGIRMGDTLLIIGAGSIGLCVLAAAKAMGIRSILVCAQTEKRLGIARQMGAAVTVASENQDLDETVQAIHPDGIDVIVDATGIEPCIQGALRLARKGGTVVLAGYGRGRLMQIRIDDIHIKNLKLIGAGNNWNYHHQAVQLLADGTVDLQPLLTHRLSLSEYDKGLSLARNRPDGFVKAVFVAGA